MSGVQSKPVLELVHIMPERGNEYVVAELRDCQADTVRFVFSCRPKVKIREYQKVKVNNHAARTYSTIFCPRYIHVKAITKRYILTDSLNVGLIREILEDGFEKPLTIRHSGLDPESKRGLKPAKEDSDPMAGGQNDDLGFSKPSRKE